MIYLQLFLSFLQIGAFSFGGGYAAMPLIQEQTVEYHAWLTMSDFTDLVTIAEMTPGPIAINAATFVGNQVAGIPGATVVAMILAAGLAILIPALFRTGSISFGQQSFDVRAAILFILAFILLRWKRPNPILVMLGCGLTEGIIQIISMYTT